MFSQTVDYALRAVTHLAYKAPTSQTTEQIADATMVPKAYLSKVLQGLVRAGLVNSQRGIGGGMTLTKTPAQMTILEVVNAVEPLNRFATCPLGIQTHGVRLCPLHRKLDSALALVESAFASTSLEQLLSEPSWSKPLCDVEEYHQHITNKPTPILTVVTEQQG
jgi:Rrf2 family protein